MNITRSTFLRAGLAAATTLATGAPLLAQGKKYVFATEGSFPPFNMTKPDGTLYGFEMDMLAEIAKRADFEYELISQAWDGMIQGVIDGKYDAVVDSVTITDKRLEVVDFSLPYTVSSSTFAVMTESGLELPGVGSSVDLNDEAAAEAMIAEVAEALKGKTVGVHVSTIQSAFLEQYLAPHGVTIRTYPNGPDVYQDLSNGRLDAAMASGTNIAAFLEKNADTAKTTGPVFAGGVMGSGAAFVVQKGNAELADKLSAALKSMSEDGTLEALSNQWFGMNVTPKL
ncbi:transporter substrate-binding domain-containing protein [Pseudogemmobacter sonorensis]|uniref:transporter substrate-binding domain-containing protein n=1 Tax=Pseudogemmobacter sonorensis TaxID=2989681 RepID=UPI0036A75B73